MKDKKIIIAKNLIKRFKDGDKITEVLKSISLEIVDGEFVAIMGRSGAGKSTTLYQLSLLDEPTEGEIILDGIDTHNMSQDDRTEFRLNNLGYVFQDYSLMTDLNAVENVALPLLMQGIETSLAFEKARQSLGSVGLSDKLENIPAKLSGGEQQRVSIARAIVHNPKILFADEPTANLDHTNSNIIIDIFKKLNKEKGLTIVMVTHENEYMNTVDRVIQLEDGKILN
ncbi:MAG: ABC transporter ATP-binding protein [Candidatus Pacebacteria bacterium]|nr:ABC transporter ATP-binding protein [Candidatus Paceibacterota bacterium]